MCYFGSKLKSKIGFEDRLEAFGIFAIGGSIGTLATGFFAVDSFGGHNGVFYSSSSSGWRLFGKQIYGVVVTIAWSAFASFAILSVIDKLIGLKIEMNATGTISEGAAEYAKRIIGLNNHRDVDNVGSASDLDIDFSSSNSISNESNDGLPPLPIPMVIETGSIDEPIHHHTLSEPSALDEIHVEDPSDEQEEKEENRDVIIPTTDGSESVDIYAI